MRLRGRDSRVQKTYGQADAGVMSQQRRSATSVLIVYIAGVMVGSRYRKGRE